MFSHEACPPVIGSYLNDEKVPRFSTTRNGLPVSSSCQWHKRRKRYDVRRDGGGYSRLEENVSRQATHRNRNSLDHGTEQLGRCQIKPTQEKQEVVAHARLLPHTRLYHGRREGGTLGKGKSKTRPQKRQRERHGHGREKRHT